MFRNAALNSFVCFLGIVTFFPCNSLLAITIDDFSLGPVTLVDTLSPGSVSNLKTGLQASHTLATARHITFNAIDPSPFGDTGQVAVQVDSTNGGSLQLNADPGLTAANLYLSYGVTSLGLPSMSLNLTTGNADSIIFDFAYAIPDSHIAFASFNLDLFVQSGNGKSFYAYQPVPSSAEPFSVQLPFSQILRSMPAFDLGNVTELRIGTANGTMKGQFALSEIRTNSVAETQVGDYNADGVADAADYVVWRKGLGSIYTQAAYDPWRGHFSETASGSSAFANPAVPEPAAAVLLIWAAVGWCLRRRKT